MDNNGFIEEFRMLGLKIAYYRKLKGHTQESLAELLGVSTSYLGGIEGINCNRKISLTTLFKIAKALEIPPHKLIDFD